VNTERGVDGSDKLASMATIVTKSPVFRLWRSGNPRPHIFYVYCWL